VDVVEVEGRADAVVPIDTRLRPAGTGGACGARVFPIPHPPGDISMPLRKRLVSASPLLAPGLTGLAPGASAHKAWDSKAGRKEMIKAVQDTP